MVGQTCVCACVRPKHYISVARVSGVTLLSVWGGGAVGDLGGPAGVLGARHEAGLGVRPCVIQAEFLGPGRARCSRSERCD